LGRLLSIRKETKHRQPFRDKLLDQFLVEASDARIVIDDNPFVD
jgi:hypothetical protein